MSNYDPNEVKKFDAMASKWWDPKGPCKPLHDLNPHRVRFIEEQVKLADKNVLDVGCGGGILSESLAVKGANTTAIDLSKQAIDVAKLHALDSGLNIDYHCTSVETFAEKHPEQFDIITCMELLEHVPNPDDFVKHLAKLLKPGGQIFLSTLNRNPKAYLTAILGAEYLLKVLPRGTHDYQKFITPAELSAMLRKANIEIKVLKGMRYNPFTKRFSLSDNISVNYLIAGQKA
ncbi:MAG: bifunctional 3-demethylubiquinol 3-O-methyltransferase/2-polyprenyl-6-hydroxyphenol methylase [Gammaproteobacteria bacterium CG11_big_fil_rev_8_21_14_0_20_46_22]|nr:MAG: bifunctional 3-demethylubiquinol 3-O-methyltransferase/2-polyprenyl-6-hydroxyphenol methylase [Gammaproteobacteria bacterium CG12_big_fil_rev_8_21_14_0_65_46_12]PIR11152.1 MAG: bifunctional 3-demethylubiquinol 3-O-methyltransferase/2-polyprenyl-6-hydroxyphenol methylase [Gammaproteobacteria bacterium CG11_big_fil_rev_8_21_14_0_20_46_22]